MLARDQSSPERTATATVIVNIRRSNFPPVFVNTPYFTGVNVGSAIGSTIYTVTATDGDLLVSITLCIFVKYNVCLLIVMYTCKYLCLWSFILFLLQWDKIPYSSFQGSIAYEVDGYLSAPAYFDVERSTGRIIIRNDFSLDITTSYLVSFSKLLNSENVLYDTKCDLHIMMCFYH